MRNGGGASALPPFVYRLMLLLAIGAS